MNRLLLMVTLALAALWAAWWFAGAWGIRRAVPAAIEAAAAEGWDVAYDELSVSGFPNRFDTTLDDLDATGPNGWGWSGPFLQVFALSYRPNHLIAVFPPAHALRTPAGPVEIAADDLRASVVLSPSTDPALRRATVAGAALRAGPVRSETAQVALREGDAELTYDVALSARDLRLDDVVRAGLGPLATLPATIDSVTVDAAVLVDRRATLSAMQTRPPRLRELALRAARVGWGDVAVTASGDLRVGRDGVLMGEMPLEVRGWRTLRPMLLAAVPPTQAILLGAGLEGMAQADGDPDTIAVPLTFEGGTMRFGPLPLGPAPRLPPPR